MVPQPIKGPLQVRVYSRVWLLAAGETGCSGRSAGDIAGEGVFPRSGAGDGVGDGTSPRWGTGAGAGDSAGPRFGAEDAETLAGKDRGGAYCSAQGTGSTVILNAGPPAGCPWTTNDVAWDGTPGRRAGDGASLAASRTA